MDNLRDLMESTVAKYGSRNAFKLKIKKDQYREVTFARYFSEICCVGTALIAEGLAGQRIAVIGKNSYNWFLANLATQFVGSICVPLDKDLKYGEFENSLARSEATVIFYDSKEKDMVEKAMASGNTSLKYAFANYDAPGARTIDELLAKGKALMDEGDTSIDDVVIDENAIAYLLFTSGTTSQAKIVMLSQRNIYKNVVNMLDVEPFSCEDVSMAILPYHHTFGSTGELVMLASGMCTVYCDGLKYLQKNMQEYGVSFFVGVPLLVETIYKKIIKTAEKEGKADTIKRFSKVVRVLNKCHIDIRRKVFGSVLNALGGKLRFVIIGASAASAECMQAFNDFGVFCIQGYGLTETAPVLIAERPGQTRIGSIGVPMKGVEIRIDNPDENGIGEICARGDNVMLGYYQNEEATNEVIIDGWFHTGDLGYCDKDGFYYITGRKKNVIVLKNGKNVFPEEIEEELAKYEYIKECIVVGIPYGDDERDVTTTAKVVYDPELCQGMSEEEIYDKVKADIEAVNATMPDFKRVHKIIVTDEEMIKTSTAKIRRFMEIDKIKASLNK